METMHRRYNGKKFLFAAVLFMGSSASALGANPADGAPQTKPAAYDFSVTSAAKDATHPHANEGSKFGFVVNGVPARTLILARGKTYTFDVDVGDMHNFYITVGQAGWGTGTLFEGVEGNFTSNGIVTFSPTATTPDILYYQCRNHKFEGGQIYVVNPGEEGKTKIAKPAATPTLTIDKGELKQKLDFADMTINKSDAAKRVMASSNAEAKAKHKDAQSRFAAAQGAFNAGNLALAKTKADEATNLMAEAIRLVPSEFMLGQAKARYGELLRGIEGLEASFAQNYESISKETGAKNLQPLDGAKIRKSLDIAKTLSAEGKYERANDILSRTLDEISIALNKMLANRTLSYEMKFATPEEEYTYELARYNHFEELIPLAIEQKQPPKNLLALMEVYIKKGKAKRDQAAADAKQKNFAAAVNKIKDASDDIDSGLKLIGVR